MPTGCDECPFENFGDCYGGKIKRIMDVDEEIAKGVRHKNCPLKEHETTDRITLARAMSDDGFKEVGMVNIMDPLRQVNVKMDTCQLYEIVKMLKEKKNGN